MRAITLAIVVLGLAVLSGCDTARIGGPEGWSAGAVDDDILYIGTMEGEVLAVNKLTGDTEWRRELPTDEDADRAFTDAPPSLVTSSLSADTTRRSMPMTIRATSSGRSVTGRIIGGPTVHEGLALVGTGEVSSSSGADGALFAIDIVDADPIWSYRTGGPIWSTRVVENGVHSCGLLITKSTRSTLKTAAQSGPTPPAARSSLASRSTRDSSIFGGFDSTLYALDADSGRPCMGLPRFQQVGTGRPRWYTRASFTPPRWTALSTRSTPPQAA